MLDGTQKGQQLDVLSKAQAGQGGEYAAHSGTLHSADRTVVTAQHIKVDSKIKDSGEVQRNANK
eukprot:SAG31_NODE_46351_length_255_cov_0.467949_1_plen_63_part_01